MAAAPARAIESARSLELTAKAASTLANLLTTSVVLRASLVKLFTAAVKTFTEFAAARPDNLVRTIASLTRLRVSSAVNPWRANSVAAVAISLNPWAVFLATANNSDPKRVRLFELSCRSTLISVRAFSTAIDSFTKEPNAFWTPLITPTAAPKAITRATEASIDFWNSPTLPVMRPKGCSKLFESSERRTGRREIRRAPRLYPSSMLCSSPTCWTRNLISLRAIIPTYT